VRKSQSPSLAPPLPLPPKKQKEKTGDDLLSYLDNLLKLEGQLKRHAQGLKTMLETRGEAADPARVYLKTFAPIAFSLVFPEEAAKKEEKLQTPEQAKKEESKKLPPKLKNERKRFRSILEFWLLKSDLPKGETEKKDREEEALYQEVVKNFQDHGEKSSEFEEALKKWRSFKEEITSKEEDHQKEMDQE
jgi:hypothetical protein